MEFGGPPEVNASLLRHERGEGSVATQLETNTTASSTYRKLGLLIDSLPPELVGEILYQVCDTNSSSPNLATLTSLRLSHVSHLWRSVALSTPSLWTQLHVVIQRADINSALELIKLWITRCKSRPIKILIAFQEERGTSFAYTEDALNIFRVLVKAAALLRKDVAQGLDLAYFESRVKAGSSGTHPIVEEHYNWFYGIDGAPSTTDSSDLTPLTVCGFRRATNEFHPEYYAPLKLSLTQLELRDTNGMTCLSVKDLLSIFSEFQQLQSVFAYIDHGDTPTQEQVVAANLKRLSIAWPYTTDCGALFDLLVAPQLEDLEILGDVPAGGPWNSFRQFVTRSRLTLKCFSFRDFDATVGAIRLTECLTECDQLESLWLSECVLNDVFIVSLAWRFGHRDSVLSRLRIFGLASAELISGECLVQTLRNVDMGRLKEFYVLDCGGVLQEHCDTIEEYLHDTSMAEEVHVTPGALFDYW